MGSRSAERVRIRERDDHLVGSDIFNDLGVLFQDNAPHVGSMATTTRLEDSCRTCKRKKFHHTTLEEQALA
jgi:hypothetical protein